LNALVRFDSRQVNADHFSLPDINRYGWNAGLDLDPGLDRKGERNSYRAALISERQAARSLEQQEGEIKLQVRNSWRTLDQAKRNYEISEVGVKIAERRVEEQNLLAELGRAKAQDQVDDLLDRIGYELYERDQLIAELTGTDAATAIALRRQGVQVGQPSQLLPVDEQPAHEQPAPPAPLDEPAEA